MRIVCIDPGRLSGVAFGTIRSSILSISAADEVEWTPKSFYEFLSINCFDTVIIEGFEYRPKYRTEAKLDLYPCYLIGVAMLYCDQTSTPIYMQPASEGKSHFSDKKLDEMGLYWKGGKGHARDAIRHLCHWAKFGPGYKVAAEGIATGVWKATDRTERQRNSKPRKPRNTGEISF